jgi:hypothetical protein
MRKEEVETALRELEIEKRVEKRVRYHCVAFWSGMMMVFGSIGSFLSANNVAFKEAMKAFLNVWLSK